MDYEGAIVEALNAAQISVSKTYGKISSRVELGQGAHGDVTYRIDKIAERAIIRVLRKRIPNSFIVSEEAGYVGDSQSKILILVDPLDGSTNAVRPIPFFSSAVAICAGTRYGELVAAGVKDLIHDRIFLATSDQGVTVDGVRAQPAKTERLDQACVGVDMKIDEKSPVGTRALLRLLSKVRYPRFLGSAALETAYVAGGIVDAFVEPRPILRSFDCIPSLFLVDKAGGFVRMLNASLTDLDLRQHQRLAYVAAGNRTLGRSILRLTRIEGFRGK